MTDDERNQPATRGDVDDLKTEVDDLKADLIERMERIETSLLRAFHGYAESQDLRMKRLDTSDSLNAERIAVIERRLTEVERRLHSSNGPQ